MGYTHMKKQALHVFTPEQRSLGGSRTKFNNLKHGRYAEKLSQAYVCPECNTAIPAGKIREQDALLAKLASKKGIYAEIKRNLVLMDNILSTSPDEREQFLMAEKINTQLMKLWEKARTEQEENGFSIAKLLEKIKRDGTGTKQT